MRRFLLLPVLCLLLALTVACSPTLNTRGNLVENDKLKGFEAGVTTQQEISQTLGSPSMIDPFDKNLWFYIGEQTETEAFFAPKVTARRVVKVQFDDTGILESVAEVDEKAGKDIALVSKTTQSGGHSVNAFQQFLGNLGKFNSNQMNNGPNPGR